MDDSPSRIGVKGAVLFVAVQVQTDAGAQADGAHDGPIRSAILGWMSISKGSIYMFIILNLCGIMPMPGGYSLMRTWFGR